MAIQQLLTDTYYGLDFEKGYLKIDELIIRLFDNKVRIDLRGYASVEARKKVNDYVTAKEELLELRRDPESDDEKITELENKLSHRPIGIYRDKIELTYDDFLPFLKTFDKEGLLAAGYNYIKTIDKYKNSIDV